MKQIIAFLCLVAAASFEDCFVDEEEPCESMEYDPRKNSAKYGNATPYISTLNEYLNFHITSSLQFLLMSSRFGSYEMDRQGFKKLYRKLSDSTWEDAIHIIKYVTMRGENVTLQPYYDDIHKDQSNIFQDDPIEISEMESLGQAVHIQKKLAEKAHNIYKEVKPQDPGMATFLQDHFIHKHANIIRELVGYTNDLLRFFIIGPEETPNSGVKVFLLDQYLNNKL